MLVIDDFSELEFLESLLRRLGFDILSLSKDLTVSTAILGFFPDLVISQVRSRAVDGWGLSQKIRRLVPSVKVILLFPIGHPPKTAADQLNLVDAFLESPVEALKLIHLLSQLGSIDETVLKEKFSKITSVKMPEEIRIRLQGQVSSPQESQFILSKKLSRQDDKTQVESNDASRQSTTSVQSRNGLQESGDTTQVQGNPSTVNPSVRVSGGLVDDSQSLIARSNLSSGSEKVIVKRQSSSTVEVKTERTRKYDQFLAEHDEPVDKTLSQAELRKEAKRLNLDVPAESNELEDKREFVRALFKK